jgi:mannosyl-3-phosphoglycerate phosphatase
MKKPIVFSDLDETLLERKTYSFEKALPALKMLEEKEIPLVLCSSKTKSEMELYRSRLRNAHPFIVENGGGIYIPENYFESLHEIAIHKAGYEVISLGTPYHILRDTVEALRSEGLMLRGFGDMSAEEIASLTRLSLEEAALAKDRDFDEAFIYKGDTDDLIRAINNKGLNLTEGRLFHITGENDKGKAVEILKELFIKKFGDAVFIAMGDSPADESMLEMVDYPVLIQKEDGTYDERVSVSNIIKAEGPGPEGWNKALLSLIEKLL